MPDPTPPPSPLEAIERSGAQRVRLAVTDIDGVMRGKFVSVDKFLSAARPAPEGGLGFCDVVFGWDCQDQCYDNTQVTGWQEGFPDAVARIDLGTHRQVPWDNDIPFFLGDFVLPAAGAEPERPHPLCPRQLLKRVLQRAERLGLHAKCGMEFEWFNFAETPQSWAEKHYTQPRPITPGMFGYSILRATHGRDFFRALMEELPRFGIPIEGLHTETGPGVYEVAIAFSDALEAADRAALFKTAVKEIALRFGIMPSFMAKWHADYPGCSGHIHQSLFDDAGRNVFHDPKGRQGMSRLFEHYVAGQLACLLDFAPLYWPTINSYKRLVDGFWAPVKPTWAVDNRTASFRVIPGSAKSIRLETRSPGADVNPYLAMAAVLAAGLHGIEQKLPLNTPPIHGNNQGAEAVPRAPRTLAETTHLFRQSAIARDWLGDTFVDHYAATRDWENRLWLDAVTDWELKRYLEII